MKAHLQTVTFLSDFGWCGGYVAACEATLVRLCPHARVLHISHDVPVGDVSVGALVLARVAPLCPVAVHLAVVDPGVGTARRPIVLSAARGDWLVGPDNGLLIDAAESLGGIAEAWVLDMRKTSLGAGLTPDEVSTTFHGRDLFAPASALLAGGLDPRSFGEAADPGSLVRLVPTPTQATGGSVSTPVIEIDRFGNVGLGLPFVELPAGRGNAADAHAGPRAGAVTGAEPGAETGTMAWAASGAGGGAGTEAGGGAGAETKFLVEVAGDNLPEWSARVVKTYADLLPGELGLIRDSWGQAALALNGASAAEFLGARRGAIVTLTPAAGAASAPTSTEPLAEFRGSDRAARVGP